MRNGEISRAGAARRASSDVRADPSTGLFAARRARSRSPVRNIGETAVRTVGVGLAFASTAFAAYMIADVERRPQFTGLEHLSIYSRPSALAARRAQTQVADIRSKVDFTPTGSIGDAQKEATIPGFLLLEVRAGTALLQTPNSIVRVTPGDVVAGLGRITAFERRNDKWVAVTPSGIVAGN